MNTWMFETCRRQYNLIKLLMKKVSIFVGSYYMCISQCTLAGSSVGIATDYGLDGPGSNPGGDEIFNPFRPALGPAQPPVKWVPDLSRG